jgi:threonine synthase
MKTNSLYISLTCSQCGKSHNTSELNNYCKDCTQPLVANYDLQKSSPSSLIDHRATGLWRYKKLLPVIEEANIVTLGEGWTPILSLNRIANKYGLKEFKMKEEAFNPTGSFKARGMSLAISKAKELGVTACCTPTAGNAGSALAAYCSAAQMKAKVFMPILTPKVFAYDTEVMGAEVVKVDGSIRDAGLSMQADGDYANMWDVSTMKEPFRLEGKKTLGYEIAEQYDWVLPDVILYPTGGGTGLIGMWKAFNEMKVMGWVDKIPRLIAIQLSGCDPVVKAFEQKLDHNELCTDPSPTAANGLRVPKAFADKLIMKAIYHTNGQAARVEESEMLEAIKLTAQLEGQFISPEGACLIAALDQLINSMSISLSENVLMINTGSGYKYIENLW